MIESLPNVNGLIIEDNEGDAFLIEEVLANCPFDTVTLHIAKTLAEGMQIITQENPDFVLLDLSLPDSVGMQTIRTVNQEFPHVAIVVMTGFDDAKIAINAVKEGAQDFLFKSEINESNLTRAINYAIERAKIKNLLEEKNSDLESLLSIISHDVRSPLGSVNSLAKIMINHPSKTDPTEFAQLILDISQNAIHFIDKIVKGYHQIGFQAHFGKVDLLKIFNTALTNIKHYPHFELITFNHHFQHNTQTFHSDHNMLLSLLQNLIGNAVNYHDFRKKPPFIAVSTKDIAGGIEIKIEDNGNGIPKGKEERIFEKLVRLSSDTKGSGLGLFIVKKVIEKLNGSLHIESEEKVGTSFFIQIPTHVPSSYEMP